MRPVWLAGLCRAASTILFFFYFPAYLAVYYLPLLSHFSIFRSEGYSWRLHVLRYLILAHSITGSFAVDVLVG